ERLSIPRPSTYMVLSGLSSVGKTQLALQLCLGTAIAIKNKGEDACVAIHEFEQTDQSMAIRLICCMAGLDSTHLDRGDFTKDDYVLFDLMADRLSELPIVFNTHTGVTRTQVGNAIHAQSNKLPVKMALVDYPELQADTGDTEEIRVATIARYYQGISRQTQTCIIGIYQYPKLDTVSMMAGYANERYSAGITQAGDSVIEVYNPPAMRRNNIDFRVPKGFDEQFAYVVLKKNRDRKTGYFPMVWEPEFVRFSDPRIEVTFGHEVYDLDTAWMYKGTGLTNEGDF
ncbi:MAG: hypothetical protein OEX12_15435, partial [Gammaproteobacteria bacterium]|nr:hypothetical protein [Gammaproteobacteria bacterium]